MTQSRSSHLKAHLQFTVQLHLHDPLAGPQLLGPTWFGLLELDSHEPRDHELAIGGELVDDDLLEHVEEADPKGIRRIVLLFDLFEGSRGVPTTEYRTPNGLCATRQVHATLDGLRLTRHDARSDATRESRMRCTKGGPHKGRLISRCFVIIVECVGGDDISDQTRRSFVLLL